MRFTCCLLALLGLLGIVCAADAPGYHLVKTTAVGGDGGWDYLTYDAMGKQLYISRSNRVMVVDPSKDGKDAVVGEISNTPGVHGIAIAPRLHRGFTSNGQENTVTVFDTQTLKETARVKVGTDPDSIIFERKTSRVFTFNGGSNDATAVDATDPKVLATIALGGRPEFATSDGQGEVFVNIVDKNEIVAIDAQTLTIKNRWPLTPVTAPPA